MSYISYINPLELLQEIMGIEKANAQDLMTSIDQERVRQDILASGDDSFQPMACTDEPKNVPNHCLTPSDQALFDDVFQSLQTSKFEAKRCLKILQKLKKKYPDDPQIHNFIGVAYHTLKQDKKYYITVKMTYKKFPDYIFGKIALAEYYLSHEQHEKIPAVFDHKFQLYMHYQDSEQPMVFHVSEMRAFYGILGAYYARSQKVAHAIACYSLVAATAPPAANLNRLAREIVQADAIALETACKALSDQAVLP